MNISLLIAVGTPVQKTCSTFFPYTPKDSKVFSNTSHYANWEGSEGPKHTCSPFLTILWQQFSDSFLGQILLITKHPLTCTINLIMRADTLYFGTFTKASKGAGPIPEWCIIWSFIKKIGRKKTIIN